MIEPDDYGYGPTETRAHRATHGPPAHFEAFWSAWRERVSAARPTLSGVGRAQDVSDPGIRESFSGVKSVEIGCRLVLPSEAAPVRRMVVTSHGYACSNSLDDAADALRAASDRGVAILLVRVRGFPGSQVDTGDLQHAPGGWIRHGLETDEGWVLPDAVADLVCAVRAMRRRFGAETPLTLDGESFGAGLAVLGAAQLAHLGAPVDRLSIGVPTFGDWPWRSRHRGLGSGGEVLAFASSMRDAGASVLERACLADAALHAPDVRVTTLAKLADRDEVVPAPTAAAVVNALGPPPERLWRFRTPYGHFDGGLGNARRHALFERLREAFWAAEPAALAPLMREWAPLMESGVRPPPGSDV